MFFLKSCVEPSAKFKKSVCCENKKFKYKQFSEVLLQNHKLSLQKQSELLNMAFDNWKGDLEQVDDVCVIGIKI